VRGLGRWLAVTLAVAGSAGSLAAPGAAAAPWHLASGFGRNGVAGLPLRERAAGSLLAAGPGGTVFVGGYADRRKGVFLVAQMSARGRLVRSFGSGGVSSVPAIYAFPQSPPRMFALRSGGLIVVGLSHADRLLAVRLTGRGRPDRAFAHDGVAEYPAGGVKGFAIVTAATVESDGDIVLVYQRQVPEPTNEPRVPEGLGEGPIELLRVLPSGSPDRSFGKAGFLSASGETPALAGYPGNGAGWACEQTLGADGSLLLAYEQAVVPNSNLREVPAVQELDPTGADAPLFGEHGAAYLPSVPSAGGTSSILCDGLFALPAGAAQAAFGGEGADSRGVELFRFTPTGIPDPAFGQAGHVTLGAPVAVLALGPGGETFSAGLAGGTLVVSGTSGGGAFDAALGGRGGKRFAAHLSRAASDTTLELLPGAHAMSIRVGEELVRIVD
jgi:hypothetical protein